MQAKGKWALAIGFVALILLGLRLLLVSGESDKDLIQATIREAIEASKEGRSGGVLEQLSRSFTFNEEQTWDRNQIAQVIKNSKPDVIIFNMEPVISGDTATVISRAQVKGQFVFAPINLEIPSVKIELARGTELRYGILPKKKWRITSITAPGLTGTEFMPQ